MDYVINVSMDLGQIFLCGVLAVLLLFVITIYGYFSSGGISVESLVSSWHLRFNYFFNTIIAPLYIFFCAVILTALGHTGLIQSLWLVACLLFIFQALVLILSGRLLYVYRRGWYISGFLSVLISVGLVQTLHALGDALLPDKATISAMLWTASLVTLGLLLKEFLPNKFFDIEAQQRQLIGLYKKYQLKYSSHLGSAYKKDDRLRRIFYAILVTEDLNRPIVFRTFERLFFRFGFIYTTGIMQVTDNAKLSDSKSVEIAQEMIRGSYERHRNNEKLEYMLIRAVAFDYNNGDFYRELIVDTYYNLKDYDQKQTKDN